MHLSNCIEYNDFNWGERKEGVIFSIRPLMAKIGNAFQTGILTLLYILLGINGFTNKISQIDNAATRGSLTEEMIETLLNSGFSPAEIQQAQESGVVSDEIKNALVEIERAMVSDGNPGLKLKIIVCVIAIALIVGSCVLMYKKFTISEEKYSEMVEAIEKRDGKKSDDAEGETRETTEESTEEIPSEEGETEEQNYAVENESPVTQEE